jgi:hypothetical protein
MPAVYRQHGPEFDLDVRCVIYAVMHSATARLYFWFYVYPKPTAAARARSF